MPQSRLIFTETLDLPDSDGPWEGELWPKKSCPISNHYHENIRNMLGYGRGTSGYDHTPSKQSRHLIILRNEGECMLHIQIPQEDLVALRFDKITLSWVDFD